MSFSSGTAIVVLQTPTNIIVGADTKVVRDSAGSTCMCKIFQVGNRFFTYAKFGGHPELSVVDFATKAIELGGPIKKIADRFSIGICAPFYSFLASYRQAEPDHYLKNVADGTALDIAIFGIEDAGTTVAYRLFTPDFSSQRMGYSGGNGLIPSGCDLGFLFLGHVAPMQAHFEQNRDLFKVAWDESGYAGLVAAVESLIKIAIADKPESVGEPITILSVSRDDTRWAMNPGTCPDIYHPPPLAISKVKPKKKKKGR
jgi:hypothetical protein